MHFYITHAYYMPYLFHPHPGNSNSIWPEQVMKLFIMLFPTLSSYSIPFRPKYCPRYSVPKPLSLCSSLKAENIL
jgi:hypothetical protein